MYRTNEPYVAGHIDMYLGKVNGEKLEGNTSENRLKNPLVSGTVLTSINPLEGYFPLTNGPDCLAPPGFGLLILWLIPLKIPPLQSNVVPPSDVNVA